MFSAFQNLNTKLKFTFKSEISVHKLGKSMKYKYNEMLLARLIKECMGHQVNAVHLMKLYALADGSKIF